MTRTLPVLDPEALRLEEEEVYRDPSRWRHYTPLSGPSRLRYVLRYLTILERCGLGHLMGDLQGGLQILEPGCGVGSFSSLLALFGDVMSFDVSPEAVRRARALFGRVERLRFFEADGTWPDQIPQLEGRTFDFILLSEFFPLSRRIEGSPPPVEVVRAYYERLTPGGVLIVEHALHLRAWRRYESVLQTQQMAREFSGHVYDTLALDVAHLLARGLSGRLDGVVRACASALSPLAILCCVMWRIDLSKTIVIQRPR
jgi:SAM-dependent methyltransferase